MFKVVTIEEAQQLNFKKFGKLRMGMELVTIEKALGRVISSDIISKEFIPNFNRSTVDGFAVKSQDLAGCSESIPAILRKIADSPMGQSSSIKLSRGECVYVPTGGAVPKNADAVVMLEYTEDFGSGEFAFYRPIAPGANLIVKGEDLKLGDVIMASGKRLTPADIGTLAAMGVTKIPVCKLPRIAIVSTGDELVPPNFKPKEGQIRDVNSVMLAAEAQLSGGTANFMGILKDDQELLEQTILDALQSNDILIVSGGTSVGEKDNLPRVVEKNGKIIVHGIAVKPGKPTIIGEINHKPIFGLPGNPVAAFFMFHSLVKPLIYSYLGASISEITLTAKLNRAVSSNHGRQEFILVNLMDDLATPIPSKSGLISTVSKANGYFIIARDQEGLPKGSEVRITVF